LDMNSPAGNGCVCFCFIQLMVYISLKFLFHIRYFPYGVNGMFAGSAIVFFSYIGFDSVSSTAEEVRIHLGN